MPHLDDAYALARWLTGNSADAEDIVQEACLRALRGLDRYAGGNARAWLLTITRNAAFTWLARNRPKALVVTEDIEALAPADGAPTPEVALIEKANAAATLPSPSQSGRLPVSIVLKSADGNVVMASFPSCIFEGLHRKIHSRRRDSSSAADAKRRSTNPAFP